MESPYLAVDQRRDGRLARLELFDFEDEDAALTRFRGLSHAGEASDGDGESTDVTARTNRATEAWRLLSEAWERGDPEGALRHIRADMTFEVRRHGVQGVSGGLDTLIENSASWTDVGLRPTFEVLALFGDRHALSALTFATEGAAHAVHLVSAAACDEEGRISSIEVFDDVDLRQAIAALARRYLDEVDGLPPVMRAWYAMHNAPEGWGLIPDDATLVDHRPGSLMSLTGPSFRQPVSYTHLDPAVETIAVRGDDLVLLRLLPGRDEVSAGSGLACVMVWSPDGGLDRWLLFAADQVDEAVETLDRLHMETLSPADRVQFETAVAQPRLFGHGDAAAAFRFLHPTEFRMLDRRGIGFPEMDVTAYLDRVAMLHELGARVTLIARRVVRCTPRATLTEYRTMISSDQGDESHQDSLMLTLSVESGLCVRQLQFDLEDEADAVALAEEHARNHETSPTNLAALIGTRCV